MMITKKQLKEITGLSNSMLDITLTLALKSPHAKKRKEYTEAEVAAVVEYRRQSAAEAAYQTGREHEAKSNILGE